MITPAYAQRMALYNRCQNQNLYGGAERLPVSERTRQTGAFFGSIHGTLNHIIFADQSWMHRFDPAQPAPRAKSIAESAMAIPDWEELKRVRHALDATIIAGAGKLDPSRLAAEPNWNSGSMKRDLTTTKWIAVTHLFNHQTHHRGAGALHADAGRR